MSNVFDPGYYGPDELRALGFAHVGEGSHVATNCTIIGLPNIWLGDRVRIDGYSTLIASQGSLKIRQQRAHPFQLCDRGAGRGRTQ